MKSYSKIGRFEIEGERGAGAAATVYSARDHATGERVAVKLIRGVSAGDLARFRREVQTLAQIQHPSVVRYVDHGHTEEGLAYLVMEWLEGEDLKSRLARGPLEIHEAIVLGRNMASALSVLHGHKLVHRDVKPGNIFLPGGSIAEAKLVDFGLVRADALSQESMITAMGAVLGTPHYMSPEQARGQVGLDARADLFSLGCVLYQCISGRAPFEGNHIVTVLTKVLLQNAAPLRELRPDVPRALADLVARMLEKQRERRPPDADTVVRALAAMPETSSKTRAEDSDAPPRSSTFRGLTTSEQSFASIILAGGALRGEATVSERGLVALVTQYGGRVDLLLDGTLVVTLSGGGLVLDQAVRAAQCALALRTVLPRSPMAIATGRAELNRPRPIGEAIERAAILLVGVMGGACAVQDAEGRPPCIAIDEVTASLIEPRFELSTGGAGMRLEGARSLPAPARTLLGKTTPMLGREWELGSIGTFFAECVESGTALPLLVTGAAGMGKSRFAHEAVSALRGRLAGVEVWWAQGDSVRTGSALGVLGQLIRSAVQVTESDPIDVSRRRLAAQIGARVHPAVVGPPAAPEPGAPDAPDTPDEWISEVLGEVAGVASPEEASPALRAARRDPRVMSERIAAAFQGLVSATCARRPLLVVIDDLQWVDAPTVRIVTDALTAVADRPWLVLGLARPEIHDVFPHLWEEHNLQEIRLRPLPRRASVQLAREALGDVVSAETIESVATQAEGNAFYLEEMIVAVAQARRGGEPSGPLPQTVLGMVQARLSELDAEVRRVLRAASVFGEVFWVSGVAALLGGALPPSVIDVLIQREIVVSRAGSRFAGERELSFRHALLREGAYATLTAADQVEGHALAGEWLEKVGEADAMVLARHFEIGGERARAAAFFLRAAQQALRAAEVDAVIERGERALPDLATDEERRECQLLLDHARSSRFVPSGGR